jgi:hypothetical protein
VRKKDVRGNGEIGKERKNKEKSQNIRKGK